MIFLLLLCAVVACSGFVPQISPSMIRQTNIVRFEQEKDDGGGIFSGISNFFQELDAFMDDASARRLGNGAAFYGKRKSNFYGEKDKNKKKDRTVSDPTEDYRGPAQAGYFQWMRDEQGEMRPVTRMKNKVIEKKD